jgi:hypothetical protein
VPALAIPHHWVHRFTGSLMFVIFSAAPLFATPAYGGSLSFVIWSKPIRCTDHQLLADLLEIAMSWQGGAPFSAAMGGLAQPMGWLGTSASTQRSPNQLPSPLVVWGFPNSVSKVNG